jgi:hypothetical protein
MGEFEKLFVGTLPYFKPNCITNKNAPIDKGKNLRRCLVYLSEDNIVGMSQCSRLVIANITDFSA